MQTYLTSLGGLLPRNGSHLKVSFSQELQNKNSAARMQSYIIAFKISLALILPFGGTAVHTLLYFGLAVWALAGVRRSLEALSLTWLISYLNPGVYALSEQGELLRWIVIIAASITVYGRVYRDKASIPPTMIWLVLFVVLSGTLSLGFSYAVDVSLFKLGMFYLGASTVLLGFHISRKSHEYWQLWFLMFFSMVTIASFPLIMIGQGYTRNGQGFQGLLSHPQTYGPFLGIFVAWMALLLLNARVKGWKNWIIIIIAVVSLIATQSRTGMLGALVAPLISMLIGIVKRPGMFYNEKRWLIRISPVIFIGIVFASYNADEFSNYIQQAMLKGRGDSLSESFEVSRGPLLSRMLDNVALNPVVGIGFGVASIPGELVVTRDKIFGLPIGAPVEKGFTVLVALEENGILGFSAFMLLVGSLLAPAIGMRTALAPAALAISTVLVNFGEATFFSMGGSGLIVWLLLGAAQIMGKGYKA